MIWKIAIAILIFMLYQLFGWDYQTFITKLIPQDGLKGSFFTGLILGGIAFVIFACLSLILRPYRYPENNPIKVALTLSLVLTFVFPDKEVFDFTSASQYILLFFTSNITWGVPLIILDKFLEKKENTVVVSRP